MTATKRPRRVETTELYHATSQRAARSILNTGFRDRSSYESNWGNAYLTGVWFFGQPGLKSWTTRTGEPANAMVCVEMPETVARRYELEGFFDGCWEPEPDPSFGEPPHVFCVPARVANRYRRTLMRLRPAARSFHIYRGGA
jgi:hypothetical protein